MQCYPFGYNGCDSGMTHCNQKVRVRFTLTLSLTLT